MASTPAARQIWRSLQGLIAVYKPPDTTVISLKRRLAARICDDANDVVLPRDSTTGAIMHSATWLRPLLQEHDTSGALMVVGEERLIDYSIHPLMCGRPFEPEDIQLEELYPMEESTSGTCVLGINDGCDRLDEIRLSCLVSGYQLDGQLGRQTERHEIRSKVTNTMKYEHVLRGHMLKFLRKMLGQHRTVAFQAADADLNSEEAFELARKGIPRSKLPGQPVIYKAVLGGFNSPYFSVDIEIVGDTDAFLRCLVHEIGCSVGSTASPLRLCRTHLGPFHAQHCLIEKQFSLSNVIRNIAVCQRVLDHYSAHVDQDVVTTIPPLKMSEEMGLYDVVGELPELGSRSHAVDDDEDAMRPMWGRSYSGSGRAASSRESKQ